METTTRISRIESLGIHPTWNIVLRDEPHDFLIKSGIYMGNSHSLSYGYLSYQTAYLKAHYPLHFYSAVLNSKLDNNAKKDYTLKRVLEEMKRDHLEVIFPNINISDYECKVSDNKLILGLGIIKNLGEPFSNQICRERRINGPYKQDLSDFCNRLWQDRMYGEKVKLLILAGVMDPLGFTRKAMINMVSIIEKNRKKIAAKKKVKLEKNKPTPEFFEEIRKSEIITETEEYSSRELIQQETEIYGFKLGPSPLNNYQLEDGYEAEIDTLEGSPEKAKVQIQLYFTELRETKTKQGKDMAFVKGEDLVGQSIKLVLFPTVWNKFNNKYGKLEGAFIVSGTWDQGSILVNDLMRLKEINN